MPDVPARFIASPLLRWLAVLLLVLGASAALFVVARRRPQRWPAPVMDTNAVGDATCISCHRDKASFEGTAHRLTTRYPTRETIAGSFQNGQNVLRTTNASLHFRMHADSAGFYQTAVIGNSAFSPRTLAHFALPDATFSWIAGRANSSERQT